MLAIDPFTEQGAVPLTIEKQLSQSLRTRLALRLSSEHRLQTLTLLATADLGWEREHHNAAAPELRVHFPGTSTAKLHGLRARRDTLVTALSLTAIRRTLHLSLSYDLDCNPDLTDHRLTATLGKKF